MPVVNTISSVNSTTVISSSDMNNLLGKVQNATDVISTTAMTASVGSATSDNCATFIQNNTGQAFLTFSGNATQAATGVTGLVGVVPAKFNGSDGYVPFYSGYT